ncbi:MAG: CHASE2 domain-containing protein [Ignavibacteriae bacterium]|nr:CHASE2 domain-containing protein [Ignavibacteriota bacterium]MCB9217277.1 CHASE2 domain-containing protein [Ignavibacteria bacterium]
MKRLTITGFRRRLPSGRVVELLFSALVMALLTLFIGDLPELEVVESTVNDDSFSDFVVTTRGELPIDTNIVVLTYGPEILDQEQRVDRSLLSQYLLALFECSPRVVAVDFLIEDERPDYPEGDEMLSTLIGDHPDDLIFGIFREDSLNRFRLPPPSFRLNHNQLGSINLNPEEDRVIRNFRKEWTTDSGQRYESLALKAARRIDESAVAFLEESGAEQFVIDYAGGIGEHKEAAEDNAVQIFPTFPLEAIFQSLFSEDESAREFYLSTLRGKGVLVGYADLRAGQVTSIVDRFYTPLKPEKNSLPDMHGVAIHANILNTILQQRIVYEVPWWINVIWGTIIVFLMYYGFEAFRRIRQVRMRAILIYGGWAILLAIALMLPITLFRYTSWKLSIYTPFAGLILGRLVLGIFDKVKQVVKDTMLRRHLRRPLPEGLRKELQSILAHSDLKERYIQSLHLLQRIFHTSCDRMFAEAMREDFGFSRETVGAPTPGRIKSDLKEIDLSTASQNLRDAAATIDLLTSDPILRKSLRVARSLVIAVNEINRQNAALDDEEKSESETQSRFETTDDYAETVISAMGGDASEDKYESFEELYIPLERFAFQIAKVIVEPDGSFRPVTSGDIVGEETAPFIVRERCQVHNRMETFVYLSEQEDANNQDDYFDLIYAGDTIGCRTEKHPGLTEFREDILHSSLTKRSS